MLYSCSEWNEQLRVASISSDWGKSQEITVAPEAVNLSEDYGKPWMQTLPAYDNLFLLYSFLLVLTVREQILME